MQERLYFTLEIFEFSFSDLSMNFREIHLLFPSLFLKHFDITQNISFHARTHPLRNVRMRLCMHETFCHFLNYLL